MLTRSESESEAAKTPPKFILLCNRVLVVLLATATFATGFVGWIAFSHGGAAVEWLWPFFTSLLLTFGHRHLDRVPAVSRFSTVFWPVASVFYIALAVVFVQAALSSGSSPIFDLRSTNGGSDYFPLVVGFSCLPAIFSLPPLVFTIRRVIKQSRLPTC